MGKSKIEWTEYSWNPIIGCTKCSPGCLNCYAERMAIRLSAMGQEKYDRVITAKAHSPGGKQKWHGTVYCDKKVLDKPLHWRKPRRIFVCSMSDLFHEKVPFDFVDKVFVNMFAALRHTYQILTKRPSRVVEYLHRHRSVKFYNHANIWLGVSISTQAEADEKIPILLKIPAAVRFVSIEPMLEAIDLHLSDSRKDILWRRTHGGSYEREFLHWVVIGAESIGGRPGRECKLDDVRDLVGQCRVANIPVFVKQIHLWGVNWDSRLFETAQAAKLCLGECEPKTKLVKDITKFPKDLQFRQYPKGGEK